MNWSAGLPMITKKASSVYWRESGVQGYQTGVLIETSIELACSRAVVDVVGGVEFIVGWTSMNK